MNRGKSHGAAGAARADGPGALRLAAQIARLEGAYTAVLREPRAEVRDRRLAELAAEARVLAELIDRGRAGVDYRPLPPRLRRRRAGAERVAERIIRLFA